METGSTILVQVYKGVLMFNDDPAGEEEREDQVLHTEVDPEMMDQFVAIELLGGLMEVRV
jgi:hypothetical protein